MPHSGLCRIEVRDEVGPCKIGSARSLLIDATRHSPEPRSEAFEEGQQFVIGFITAWFAVERFGPRQDLFFQSKVGV